MGALVSSGWTIHHLIALHAWCWESWTRPRTWPWEGPIKTAKLSSIVVQWAHRLRWWMWCTNDSAISYAWEWTWSVVVSLKSLQFYSLLISDSKRCVDSFFADNFFNIYFFLSQNVKKDMIFPEFNLKKSWN